MKVERRGLSQDWSAENRMLLRAESVPLLSPMGRWMLLGPWVTTPDVLKLLQGWISLPLSHSHSASEGLKMTVSCPLQTSITDVFPPRFLTFLCLWLQFCFVLLHLDLSSCECTQLHHLCSAFILISNPLLSLPSLLLLASRNPLAIL